MTLPTKEVINEKYDIKCSKDQLKIIDRALRIYFRLLCGQFDIAFEDFRYDDKLFEKLNPAQQLLVKHIQTTNKLNEMFGQSENTEIAFDMHQVIRNLFYKEDGRTSGGVDSSVTKLGKEDLIEVKIVKLKSTFLKNNKDECDLVCDDCFKEMPITKDSEVVNRCGQIKINVDGKLLSFRDVFDIPEV